MTVAYSSQGAVNSVGPGASLTITNAANPGDTVVVWVQTTDASPTAVYDPTGANLPMTRVGTPLLWLTFGFNFYLVPFVLQDAPGGPVNIVITPSASAYIKAKAFNYSGVARVGTVLTTATSTTAGSFTAMSLTVPAAAGALVSQCFAVFATPTLSAYNQTQRWLDDGGGAWNDKMLVGDAPGDTSVLFTAANSSSYWGAAGIVLYGADPPPTATITITGGTPSLDQQVSPPGATTHITGGTPTVTQADPNAPASAQIVITGATPEVSQKGPPDSATITITGGTPEVSQLSPVSVPPTATLIVGGSIPSRAQSYGPLARVINNLTLGQSSTIQVIGDSTALGYQDAYQSSLFGWPGRMALALGIYYDVNVVVSPFDQFGLGYDPAVTVHTSSRGAQAPTLTVMLGAANGARLVNYRGNTTLLPPSNPDVVIINDGFNEQDTASITSGYLSTIAFVQTQCPGSPIIVTTENATTATSEGGSLPAFSTLFAAMVDTFIPGATLPLSPPLQYSTAVAGVWVLDTKQAGQTAATLSADGLHPVAAGYAEQAQFMLKWLVLSIPQIAADAGLSEPGDAPTQITGGTLELAQEPAGSDSPPSADVVIAGGTPSLDQKLSPPSAPIGITGGTPAESQRSNTDSPGSAALIVRGGTPVVGAGSTTLGLHEQQPVSSEQFFVAWLRPLGRTTIRVNDDTPLPVRRVQQIWGVDDLNLFWTTARVKVHTMCNYSADGDNWEIDAEAEAQRTHDRILYLASHDVSIQLPDGRIASPSYLEVIQVPLWIDYENDQILDKEAEYEIGLDFTSAAP